MTEEFNRSSITGLRPLERLLRYSLVFYDFSAIRFFRAIQHRFVAVDVDSLRVGSHPEREIDGSNLRRLQLDIRPIFSVLNPGCPQHSPNSVRR